MSNKTKLNQGKWLSTKIKPEKLDEDSNDSFINVWLLTAGGQIYFGSYCIDQEIFFKDYSTRDIEEYYMWCYAEPTPKLPDIITNYILHGEILVEMNLIIDPDKDKVTINGICAYNAEYALLSTLEEEAKYWLINHNLFAKTSHFPVRATVVIDDNKYLMWKFTPI